MQSVWKVRSWCDWCTLCIVFQKIFGSSQLPPTKDALSKHTSLANYQAAIWRRALDTKPDVPTPHGHGWILRSGSMHIDWMGQLAAPEAILKLIHCNCIKSNVLLINVPVVQIHWLAQTVMTVKMNLTCRFKYPQKMKRMIVTLNKRNQGSWNV